MKLAKAGILAASATALVAIGAGAGLATNAMTAPAWTSTGFAVHTVESAPLAVANEMGFYTENFGFIPNLAGVMADSPALLKSYITTYQNLSEHGALSGTEINVVALAISRANECTYCIAGHTMVGKTILPTPDDVLESLRNDEKIADDKLEALRQFSIDIYQAHGQVSPVTLKRFLEAGYDRQQALDVVAVIGWKIMSNIAGDIAEVQLDEFAKPFEWSKK